MANVLHGSANAIGGQNAVVKLRWGAPAEGLVVRGRAARRSSSRWARTRSSATSAGGRPTGRAIPQTRMGVEQIIRDRFSAARDYAARVEGVGQRQKPDRLRRSDLRARGAGGDARRQARRSTATRYRQDEILMLLRVCRRVRLPKSPRSSTCSRATRWPTRSRSTARAASSFSDWWAYKFEVWDAIPCNGPLMQSAGVVVSLQLRRQRAGAPPQRGSGEGGEVRRRLRRRSAEVRHDQPGEAAAASTSTSARSKPGKDADFVIWSGPPLSTLHPLRADLDRRDANTSTAKRTGRCRTPSAPRGPR